MIEWIPLLLLLLWVLVNLLAAKLIMLQFCAAAGLACDVLWPQNNNSAFWYIMLSSL